MAIHYFFVSHVYRVDNLVWASHRNRGNLDKILKIKKKIWAIFMFKCVNNMMPLKKSYTFPANSSVHSHFTRRCGDLHVNHCRTLCRWTTVQIEGPKLWNMLPMSFKNLPTLPQLKYKVKQYFIHLID